ncbi:MAG: hypothetical protein JSW21_09555 [Gammaproteobacteria bacterium]|nr:MAG: hypothetical protein JSW21_09555 [Gammaproteobacteria bacterium]
MRRPSCFLTIIAAVCCLCATTALADLPLTTSADPVPAGIMEVSYQRLSGKTTRLASDRDAGGLARHLAKLKSERGLTTREKEKLLHETVRAASALDPVPDLRREVEDMTAYRSQTQALWNEHGHTERRIAYDIAAAARHALRVWNEDDARRYAKAALDRYNTDLIERYLVAAETDRRGIETAFREATPGQLAFHGQELEDGLHAGKSVGALAAIAARKTGDVRLMHVVLAESSTQVALESLSTIDAISWPGAATALFMTAARRPEIASAALLGLGRLAVSDMDARDILLDNLGGPNGASAAAALGRLNDDRVIAQLKDVLFLETDETRVRHALLALRLSGSSSAKAILADFANQPTTSPDLASEVPPWLRD